MGERYLEELNIELASAVGHPRTVLDVGCGRGLNGLLAKERGAHVVGLESWGPSVQAARDRLDEVFEVDIETDEAARVLDGRKFDTLIFGDVLEHTRDPLAVLTRFLPNLEDGGHVIVSLPNVAAWPVRLGLLAGQFEYAQSGILDETHLRFFTRQTATRLVEKTGLELLWVGLNPMIVRAGLGLVRKVLLDSSGGGNSNPADLVNHPLYKLYERWVRPVERRVGTLAPGLLSFQTVIVARARPRRRPQTLTIGMISMNEEGAVGAVVDDIRKHASAAEILLVDSSKDRTPEIAEARGARVVRQFPPRGYGPAMHRLLYEARSDVIITMDCDGTYPAEHIPKLLRLVEDGADLVNATRTRHRPKSMPLANYVANRVFAATTGAVHGIETTDVHSGMRAYRTSMLRGIAVDPNGPALPVDLLIVPARLGYEVVEVEIPYADRIGNSSLQRLSSTGWTFKRIFRSTQIARAKRGRVRIE